MARRGDLYKSGHHSGALERCNRTIKRYEKGTDAPLRVISRGAGTIMEREKGTTPPLR